VLGRIKEVLCPELAFSNYQARFGPHPDVTVIPRAFYEKHHIPIDYHQNIHGPFDSNPQDISIHEDINLQGPSQPPPAQLKPPSYPPS